MPVQEMVSTPEPKYSTMAPVPPFTVRMPATLQMMSLGEFHLASLPVSFTPITCRCAPHTRKAALRAAPQLCSHAVPWHGHTIDNRGMQSLCRGHLVIQGTNSGRVSSSCRY